MSDTRKIIYTITDEAPALATESFLPIISAFAGASGVGIDTRDISLAGRIIAALSEFLPEDQRLPDDLAELGALTQDPDANIIKLPNISASVPQLKAAVKELQDAGVGLPDYPDEPSNDREEAARAAYDSVKGSAVNPVLREGNSDRRAPAAVKTYARNYPHSMGEWSAESKSHVATMGVGDFRSNEQSVTLSNATTARIEHVATDGTATVLKDQLALQAGEVLDATFMSTADLVAFLRQQIADANESGVLFSVHLKATMMKVSDPIIFGHVVRTFFTDVFDRHADALAEAGVDPNDGLASLLSAIESLPEATAQAIRDDLTAAREAGPDLAMVDSRRDITNLHVPSDVIIDASMPAMIRTSGQMWNADDETQDAKAVIPDSSYAAIYAETIEDCKRNGAFDPATMGSVPNVGLMAKKAEEYGSHDKTFTAPADGTIRVVDAEGVVLTSHNVSEGDIWRACQTKDEAVRNWVQLAVTRSRASGTPAVFWLDETRAHDAQLINKVRTYLSEHDTSGLQLDIMAPGEATRHTLARVRAGEDAISVTGNVLRDYLTDLFPILELGTSAKMLSIVPLLNGGGLFETGAGGSAPKHVQQVIEENHLRWDSLGEFLALAASLEHFAEQHDNAHAKIMATALDRATGQLLEEGKSPKRKVGELDNRGSQFYLAMYWAQELAGQGEDGELAAKFRPLAEQLSTNEATITDELAQVQGEAADLGGYYRPDPDKAGSVMRPSATLNRILAEFAG